MKGLTCPSKRQKAHETSWFFSFWDDCSCCVSVSVTVMRCSSLFFWSRVSSGPWCQSAHQSAGLLLRRPAAQRSYTWAGPRCGSTEVRHTHTHTHTRFHNTICYHDNQQGKEHPMADRNKWEVTNVSVCKCTRGLKGIRYFVIFVSSSSLMLFWPILRLIIIFFFVCVVWHLLQCVFPALRNVKCKITKNNLTLTENSVFM